MKTLHKVTRRYCNAETAPVTAACRLIRGLFGLTSNPLRLKILSTGAELAEGENMFFKQWVHCLEEGFCTTLPLPYRFSLLLSRRS